MFGIENLRGEKGTILYGKISYGVTPYKAEAKHRAAIVVDGGIKLYLFQERPRKKIFLKPSGSQGRQSRPWIGE